MHAAHTAVARLLLRNRPLPPFDREPLAAELPHRVPASSGGQAQLCGIGYTISAAVRAPSLRPTGVAAMAPARRLLAVAALLMAAGAAQAYYLPGTYPQEFLIGDVIQGERGQGACHRGFDTCPCFELAPSSNRCGTDAACSGPPLPAPPPQPRLTRWCPPR